MDNKSKYASLSGVQLPDTSMPESPAEPDINVEWVLEHLPSPFRWEFLEAPPALLVSPVPDKCQQQKLNSRR